MEIAVCDDNAHELLALTEALRDYCDTRDGVCFTAFTNAVDLLAHIKAQDCDVLLLDILMPGLTGMEAAREIRQFNEKIEMIFLTSSREFAVDSYRVRAFDYLLKPVSEDTLFPALDRLRERFHTRDELLHLQTSQRIVSLPVQRIEAVEVIDKTLFFHLTDGTCMELRYPLSDCEKLLLSRPEFIKPHRSYLVNLRHMRELGPSEFISLSGRRFPVARGHYKLVRETYVRHLFAAAEEE